MQKEIYNTVKSVVFGHAVADALGVPAEFASREELDAAPVCEMEGFGTYPYPAGCWSDDTSMSLAALDSLATGKVDYDDIMEKFGAWYYRDEYTPTGELFDIGNTCTVAIENYFTHHIPALQCGPAHTASNGNGSLMRIHPFVLYSIIKGHSVDEMIAIVHDASALTHGHERSKVACGIYAFILTELIRSPDKESVYVGLKRAAEYYKGSPECKTYSRLLDPELASIPRSEIKSSGYVVDTLEAAVWCLLTTESYAECALAAVNLGSDTDTVAAIAGGLAGALYGLDAIPKDWLKTLTKQKYIDDICKKFVKASLK